MKKVFVAVIAFVLAITAVSCAVIKGTTAEAGGANVVYQMSLPDGWMLFDYSDANRDNIKIICTDNETDINGKQAIQVFAETVEETDTDTFIAEQTKLYTDSGAVVQDGVKIAGLDFSAVSTDVNGIVSETYYTMDDGLAVVITLTNGAVMQDEFCEYILSNLKIKPVEK
jgi:hypothetical protein